MIKPPTDSQIKLLTALEQHGGVLDRYSRVVASGNTFQQGASFVVLKMVAQGWIIGIEGRLMLTQLGRRVLEESLYEHD